MSNMLLDLLEGAGNVLDTPGSVVRGLLSGQPGKAFGGILDPEQRVSGRALLEQLGLVDQDSGFGGDAAGFAASIATDPLTFLGGFLGKKAIGALRGSKAAPASKVVTEASPIAKAITGATEAAPVATAEVAPLARMIEGPVAAAPRVEQAAAPMAQALAQGPAPTSVATPLELAPPFYSRLERAAQGLPEGGVKAESLMNKLKKAPGGVSQEELDTVMGNFAGKGKVAKADVLKHIDENKIEVKEVWKEGDAAKYTEYSTPGGVKGSHREILFTAPDKNSDAMRAIGAKYGVAGKDLSQDGLKAAGASREELAQFGKAMQDAFKNPAFTSPHVRWDEVNQIGHMRVHDRIGPKGGKTLHIDELQSMHQEGKKVGYKPKDGEVSAVAKEFNEFAKPLKEKYGIKSWTEFLAKAESDPGALLPQERKTLGVLKEKYDAVLRRQSEGIHDLPLKEAWAEHMMKRAIRFASEKGYDRITWSGGEQVNKLVGQPKTLGGMKAFYDETMPNWMNKYAKKWNVQVGPADLGNDIVLPLAARDKLRAATSLWEADIDPLIRNLHATGDVTNWPTEAVFKKNPELASEMLKALQKGPPIRGFGIDVNPAMRQDVNYKGQSLMGLLALLGGGAAVNQVGQT